MAEDCGKVGSYPQQPIPRADGGIDEGCRVAFDGNTLEPYSEQILEISCTKIMYDNLEPDPHESSFSHAHNGGNTPYADQHAPQSGPKTSANKKGS